MPERLLSISRLWVKAEQADADRHPTPQLWPLVTTKAAGSTQREQSNSMPLKLRPTGLGPGIDKDRPDHTVYTGRCLFGLP
jgi:hypothetical protein